MSDQSPLVDPIELEKSRCVCETLRYAPGGNKVQKAIFSFKGQSQGHKVIDHGVI